MKTRQGAGLEGATNRALKRKGRNSREGGIRKGAGKKGFWFFFWLALKRKAGRLATRGMVFFCLCFLSVIVTKKTRKKVKKDRKAKE